MAFYNVKKDERIIKLKGLIEDASKNGNFTALQLRWLRDRWLDEYAFSRMNWRVHGGLYLVFRSISMTGALAVPVLAGASIANTSISLYLRIATLVAGLLAAAGTAVIQVVRPLERSRSHRIAYAALEAEGWLFFEQRGRYSTTEDLTRGNHFGDFVDAVEKIVRKREAQIVRLALYESAGSAPSGNDGSASSSLQDEDTG